MIDLWSAGLDGHRRPPEGGVKSPTSWAVSRAPPRHSTIPVLTFFQQTNVSWFYGSSATAPPRNSYTRKILDVRVPLQMTPLMEPSEKSMVNGMPRSKWGVKLSCYKMRETGTTTEEGAHHR